jgi:Mn2+/Fe2+ NRAMP family transporter
METLRPDTSKQTRKDRAEQKKQARSRFRFGRSGMFRLLGVLGPGLVAASAGNDAGGIVTYSTMGAKYGYQMLWVMIILLVGVSIVQEMCARMGAATGKGLSDLIRENFPIHLTAFVMLTFFIANTGVVISEFVGIAVALELFGIPAWIGAPLGGLAVWLLVTRGSYDKVEKVFLALTIVFFAYIIASFMAQPHWDQVLYGTFVPTIQFNAGYISVLIGAIGTTISPYMQIYVQSATVERGLPLRDYNYVRTEVYAGSFFSVAIAYFIIVCTGATLFNHGTVPPDASADFFANALVPFLGNAAKYVFAIGLLGASFLAAGVLPLTTSYAVTEVLGLENSVSRRWKDAPVFWTLFTALIVVSVIVAAIPNLPVTNLLIGFYMLNGVLLPVILFSILRLVNRKRLMGKYTNSLFYNILSYSLASVVSVLALFFVFNTLLGLFGVQILPQ